MDCSVTLTLTALLSLHAIEQFSCTYMGDKGAATFVDQLLERSVAAIEQDLPLSRIPFAIGLTASWRNQGCGYGSGWMSGMVFAAFI